MIRPTPEPRGARTLVVLTVLLGAAGSVRARGASIPSYHHLEGGQARASLAPEVVLRFPAALPPNTFLPLGGGEVLLLELERPRLRLVRPGAPPRELALTRDGAPLEDAYLTDAVAGPRGWQLLDEGQGTILEVSRRGEVRAAFGHVVAGGRLGRDVEGRVTLRDPGASALTVFAPGDSGSRGPAPVDPGIAWGDGGVAPYAGPEGDLPYLQPQPCARPAVALLYPHGAAPAPLGFLEARPGWDLMEAEVVGRTAAAVYLVAVRLGGATRGGTEDGVRHELWRFSTRGEGVEVQDLESLPSTCADCGPRFRVDDAGDLWAMDWADGAVTLLRYRLAGELR